jgi:hypothetical protein
MRRTVISCLALALVSFGLPSVSLAAASAARPAVAKSAKQNQPGTIRGDAKNAQGETLAQNKVRIRNSQTGSIAAELTTDAAGTFSGAVPAGSYVVEIIGANGAVIGMSPVLTVAAGSVATVSVTASAVAAVAGAAAAGGGFGVFGLGTITSIAVLGGAATATVFGIKAATNDASPSR